MSNPSVQRQALDRAIAAWNARDLAGYLELYSHRIALYGYTRLPMNRAEVLRLLRAILRGVLRDPSRATRVRRNVNRRLGCGSRCTRLTPARSRESLLRVARISNKVGITIMRFDGDRVRRTSICGRRA